MKYIIIICLLVFSCQYHKPSLNLYQAGAGIIYGKNHSYVLSAPNGWILDNKSGVNQGLYAVFYPIGSTWQNSIGIVYTKAIGKDSIYKNIEEYIRLDLEEFKKSSPNISATLRSEIKLKDNKVAKIYEWLGDKWDNLESTAYINENKVIVIITFNSRNNKFYKSNYSKFIEIVQSYMFLTENVNQLKTK